MSFQVLRSASRTARAFLSSSRTSAALCREFSPFFAPFALEISFTFCLSFSMCCPFYFIFSNGKALVLIAFLRKMCNLIAFRLTFLENFSIGCCFFHPIEDKFKLHFFSILSGTILFLLLLFEKVGILLLRRVL